MSAVYLVDGSGYIFRAFYAIAPLSNKQGLPTNALLGFTRMLAKLIRDVDAKHIAVAFDTGHPTFRHELYGEYKANRDECPADLIPQMPYFRKIVEALGIQCLEKPGFEADDVIATLASRMRALGQEVVVVSGDKDLLQLVDEKVKVFDAMRDITFDREKVIEKFGVSPEQMRDYLAIVGDTSDNVPGIKGVGPKTAQQLLAAFGSIEKLINGIAEIEQIKGLRGAKGIREKVELGAEQLRLSQRLVSLDADVEPYNRISDVEQFQWTAARMDLLGPLFAELDFGKVLATLRLDGVEAAADASFGGDSLYSAKKFHLVQPSELAAFATELSQVERFAFDTETSGLDCLSCSLVGISISWKAGEAYFIPLGLQSEPEKNLDAETVRAYLGPIFSNPNILKAGANLKFDVSVLEENGYEVRGLWFDTMISSHLLHPDRRENGLKNLTERHLQEQMTNYRDLVGDLPDISHVPVEKLVNYACHDAEASFRLAELMEGMLRGEESSAEGPSLMQVFQEVEMPLISVLSRMERNGIKVNVEFLEGLGSEFGAELVELEKRIHQLAGREFNINSPKQLGAVLFDELKIPVAGVKRKQSGYSTDASVLSKLSAEHEIARQLLEYRELHKLNSTYVESLKSLVHGRTKRIHSSFNQTIAATGRLSSTDPNLQNIPIRNPRGRRLRSAFVAEPGHRLIAADYSQIELRILAHLAGDKNLRQAFLDGEDIHERTARELFGTAIATPAERKDLRRVAKTINFGIVYGMGAFRLASDLGISRKQAQQYIDDYNARYPGVQKYYDSLRAQIEGRGYVETMFGRRRMRIELDTAGRDAGYAERSLLNAPIQGSAAEVIKLAMIKIDQQLQSFAGRAKMVLQVHDELVFEVESSLLDEVQQMVVNTMETAVQLSVPLKVDVRSGATWGEEVC